MSLSASNEPQAAVEARGDDQQLFSVRLAEFDGPIDLLLHLVKQRELPIEQLSLGLVAEQYLACLEYAGDIEVEVAGEYLVIASTLLSIKAKYVLREPVEELVGDEEPGGDPHEELLLAVRMRAAFEEGCEFLAEKPLLAVDVFGAPKPGKARAASLAPLREHDPMLLGKALRALARRRGFDAPQPMTVVFDPVSVEERMSSILEFLRQRQLDHGSSAMLFDNLVEGIAEGDLGVLITCFLALLELTRKQEIAVRQEQSFAWLTIVLAEEVLADCRKKETTEGGNSE